MTDINGLLQSLRELRYEAPSARTWLTLTECLDAFPNDALPMAMDYVEPLVQAWPEAICHASPKWAYSILTKTPDPRLVLVRHLRLTGWGWDTEAATRIAACPLLSRITLLDLRANAIGNKGVAALASSPHLCSLTHLDLSQNGVTMTGARALAQTHTMTALQSLDLSHNQIGEQGVARLLSKDGLPALTHLALGHNGLNASAATALVNSPGAARLTHLELTGNPLSNVGAAAIQNTDNLGALERIDLRRCQINKRTAQLLAEAFKDVEVLI